MTLHTIIIGGKAKEPLHYVDTIREVQGRGLEGDWVTIDVKNNKIFTS